jgi:hypothetical protein
MTTQTAVLAAETGLTPTAKLFTMAAPDTVAFTADSVTERTNAKGQYVASFGEASAISGDYTLILFSGTRPVAIGYRTFAGTDAEVATETPPTVELDSASLRSAVGMSAADLDDQLDAILAAASAGAGTGARTVTITVDDGTTALQNAVVRFNEGSNTFRALTNASGVAVFNLDDATYTVAVTKSGYTYAGTTLVVDGTETATYSMTVNTVTPPDDPALCAVTFHLRDQYGTDLADQPVEITWVQWDDAATETPPVLSVPPVQETDADGEVSVNLYRNAQYKIVYGEGRHARRWDGTIPNAGSYEVEL